MPPLSQSPFSSSSPTNEFTPPGVLRPQGAALPVGGAIALLVGSLILGVLLGVLYHFVARWMDLVMLFPLGFGLMLGALLAIPIYRAKIRARSLIIICALLASTLLIGTRLFCDSLQMRELMIQSFSSRFASTPRGAQIEARLRSRVTPLGYFKSYLQNAARSGVVIGDVGKSSSASDLVITGPWYWGSQLLNLALVAATAVGAALNYAGAPFCEKCRKWLGQSREITKVHPEQSFELIEKLKRKDWEGAANIVGKNMEERQQSVVSVASCPTCGETQLKVKTTRGATPKTVLEMPVSSAEAEKFRQARAQRL